MEAINIIKNANNIVITGHVNPDGDAVGSGLALYISLKNTFRKKNIKFILQDEIPFNTKFLKYSDEVLVFNEDINDDFDLIIYVDSASRERTGKVGEKYKNIKSLNIDHHISNNGYGELNLIDVKSSSTSEMMYEFLKNNNFYMDKSVLEALYLGIVNDTGNFSHDNVSINTMKIATELIAGGVNNSYVVSNFLNSNSIQRLRLLGDALNNFSYYDDVKLSYYFLSLETMKKLNAKKEDCEGLVEKILSYEKSEVALFLREEIDGKIKGSMRSKNKVDVNQIAGIFGGGGHIKAAGFTSNLSQEEVFNKVYEFLKKS